MFVVSGISGTHIGSAADGGDGVINRQAGTKTKAIYAVECVVML